MRDAPSKSCRSTLIGISPHRPELPSTDLFASPSVPVDNILVLDGPAAPVLFQRVLHLSAALTSPGLEARILRISGLPDPDIDRQSSSDR